MCPSHQSTSLWKQWLDGAGHLVCGCIGFCGCSELEISGWADCWISVVSDVWLSELVDVSGGLGFWIVSLLERCCFGLFGFCVFGVSCSIYATFRGNISSSFMFGVSWFVGTGVFFVFSMLLACVIGLTVICKSASCCMFCWLVFSVWFSCYWFFVGWLSYLILKYLPNL